MVFFVSYSDGGHTWPEAFSQGVKISDEIKYIDVQWEHITTSVAHHGWLGNVTKYIRYSEMLGNTRHGCGKGNLEL